MTTQEDSQTRARKPRRFTWALLALPLLIGAGAFSVAYAHGPGGPGDEQFENFRQQRMDRLLDAAKATDAQKQQIKAIFDKARPQMKALREQQATLRKQIRDALTAPTIDAAAIEQLREQQMQLMDKTSALFTQNLVSAAKVLTPDQRKQVAEQIAEHRGHHGHGPWSGTAGASAPQAD